MFEPTYTFIETKNEEKKRFVQPSEKQNNSILSRNDVHTNFTYREYLTDNGKKIIQKNKELYKNA